MVNWETDLKKYIAKKLSKIKGFNINPDEIKGFRVNTDIDISKLDIRELATIYAFAIMQENFEQANAIVEEFARKNCEVKIDVDDFKKTGNIDVHMKILPDGMIMDFEKENF
jgi:hypothetical protein